MAAGQECIPTAFVVDQHLRIAWIGDPTELKESLLEQILSGNFNLEKESAKYEARRKRDEQVHTLWRTFNEHRQKEEWDQAEAALGQIEKLLPEGDLDTLAARRFGLLLDRRDYKAAYKLAEQLSDGHLDNADLQNGLAWDMATRQEIEERNLNLAETIARRANDAAQGKDPGILDTMALVQFLQGQQQAAVESEQKVVELADGPLKERLQKILDSYKECKLPIQRQLDALWYRFNQHCKKKEWNQAETTLDQIEKLVPESQRPDLAVRRFEVLLDRHEYADAYKFAAQLSAAHKEEPMLQNEIAWQIATREGVADRDLGLAEKIARQADESTQGGNAEIVDTLARVLFIKGQRARFVSPIENWQACRAVSATFVPRPLTTDH